MKPGLNQRVVLALLIASVLILVVLMRGADWMKRPRRAMVMPVEELWVEEENYGPAERERSERPGLYDGESEASSTMELALEVDAIGRELLLKVLEGGGEETKDLMTPRFLEDLEQNRAILQNADLARLQLERQGKYWLSASAPFQLPPRVDGEEGKAGLAQLRLVFMDGRWRLHELGLSIQ